MEFQPATERPGGDNDDRDKISSSGYAYESSSQLLALNVRKVQCESLET